MRVLVTFESSWEVIVFNLERSTLYSSVDDDCSCFSNSCLIQSIFLAFRILLKGESVFFVLFLFIFLLKKIWKRKKKKVAENRLDINI